MNIMRLLTCIPYIIIIIVCRILIERRLLCHFNLNVFMLMFIAMVGWGYVCVLLFIGYYGNAHLGIGYYGDTHLKIGYSSQTGAVIAYFTRMMIIRQSK